MYGYDWSFRYLWFWMNWLQRLDVIVLALMLAHIVVVVIHVFCRYRIARRVEAIDIGSRAFQRGRAGSSDSGKGSASGLCYNHCGTARGCPGSMVL